MAPRFLYIDIAPVEPDRATSSVRSAQMIALAGARGMAVDVATLHPERIGVESGPGPAGRTHAETLQALGARSLPWCDEETRREFLRRHAADYDVIAFAFSNVARRFMATARAAAPKTLLLYDTHDVNHVREFREARVSGNQNTVRRALATRTHEAAALAIADVAVAITEADAAAFRALAPAARLAVVSIWQEPALPAESPGAPTLLFVGHYGASFNHDAAFLLAREILPRVRAARADVTLTLAGSDPAADVKALAAGPIAVPGWLADLGPLYRAAGIFVAPLRFGSGLKGKMLQAMSHGLPIVASGVAAEGIPIRDDVDYLAADTVDTAAAAILRLLDDAALARRLGASARRVLTDRYGRDTVARQFEAALAAGRSPKSD